MEWATNGLGTNATVLEQLMRMGESESLAQGEESGVLAAAEAASSSPATEFVFDEADVIAVESEQTRADRECQERGGRGVVDGQCYGSFDFVGSRQESYDKSEAEAAAALLTPERKPATPGEGQTYCSPGPWYDEDFCGSIDAVTGPTEWVEPAAEGVSVLGQVLGGPVGLGIGLGKSAHDWIEKDDPTTAILFAISALQGTALNGIDPTGRFGMVNRAKMADVKKILSSTPEE